MSFYPFSNYILEKKNHLIIHSIIYYINNKKNKINKLVK